MPTRHVNGGSTRELQQIADDLGKSRKVIVVTGAGISTNCGIPDFRSEDGLYSLIQAQYDAALLNPPWERQNMFDIDDRPKKKRKQWYYEVVAANGQVVDVIDEEIAPLNPVASQELDRVPEQEPTPRTTRRSSRSRSTNTTSSNSRASSPIDLSSDLSSLSSCPPSSPEPANEIPRETSPIIIEASSPLRHSSRKKLPSGPQIPSVLALETESNDTTIVVSSPHCTLQQEYSTSSSATTSTEDPSNIQSSQSSRTLPNLKGRDLFDSMIWQDAFTTSVFYMFISSLRQRVQEVRETTETHKFLRTLRDGGRLARVYTQNIDRLEEREGLSGDISLGTGNRTSKTKRESGIGCSLDIRRGCEVVPLHGTLARLRCNLCFKSSSWDEEERGSATLAGTAPDCPFCAETNAKRTTNGRRRVAIGRLRPDIVLYGEEHPQANLIGSLVTNDLGLPLDTVLIMGTSLRVHGLKIMVKEFAKAVHARGGKVVFVNRTKPSESTWGDTIDYWVEMDCDEWVLDLKARRRDIWLPPGRAVEAPVRRQSAGDALPITKKRPQAFRDDKVNGVFVTFKILDMLAKFSDPDGNQSTRFPYWQSTTARYSSASMTELSPVEKQPLRPPSKKPPRKSLAKSTPKSRASTPNIDLPKRHRQSLPAKVTEAKLKDYQNKKNQAYIVGEMWSKIRESAPSLPSVPPELRQPFSDLPLNLPSYLTPFEFGASNHFPNLGGREWPLAKMGMDLMHLPQGLTIPVHTPKSNKPGVLRSTVHNYGTRASSRSSNAKTIVVDTQPASTSPIASTSTCSSTPPNTSLSASILTSLESDDTIVVDDPLTPSSIRIKRLGCIGNVVSSPEEGAEIWHDAPEAPEVMT